jgi:hypothetical protein
MIAHLHSTRVRARTRPSDIAVVRRGEGLKPAASLVASIPAAVNASVCLQVRRDAARFALFLRLATRRPPRGLLAELL